MNAITLSISDLNTTINHEPRILDATLGKRLGMARPTNIRQIVEANRIELESHGRVCTQSVQTSKQGGRPTVGYWLNEAQALLVCMFSRTDRAAEVRKALIEVYQAYRSGALAPAASAQLTPADRREINRLAQEWSRADFNRYRKELESRAIAALAKGLPVKSALSNQSEPPKFLPPYGGWPEKSGIGAICLGSRTILFDSADWMVLEGGQALVAHQDGRIDVATIVDSLWGRPGWESRGKHRVGFVQDPVPASGALASRSVVVILGRVLGERTP